ncbi:Nonsense-mediated mRNA decay protein Upf3, putative [Penicillium digitatum]|uniref:Nonsense-mediated mRNA decay protein Upf3, putative n=3 Tax=Penicillium digitatum TaxID=36651 RepID=K9FYP7_PEND2|nr:Nonsense-mediated mRNA decay protein Upf3, putative [Penicillium digitatum Pd1]EKV13712.1 Nonsense-mediated mRNA decay protein Upf3, putative [Penicillium digitatum PHI26]EKV21562.1 Nonsense-mediated mRNA decay protein Upf3, putative [Penicillium digitatum Pd1]QQK42173.1 Nonsense-mediated mRNA decay protein Upf3, putative [Penicillium digitatum]
MQPGKITAGLLPISAGAMQKSGSGAPARKTPKPPAPRLKLLIRRLPPGLTRAELENSLGDQWKAGAGNVDWLQFKPGKVSKDPNKSSRPSRAYVHVVSTECVSSLSDAVRQASFQDARNTLHDPILLGPPSLEFAPYAKTPGSRSRKDARQGTIDQDSEFIAFLESLTQPITRPAAVDSTADCEDKKKETIVTTPLVQFIKDKKASKLKDGSGSKSKHSRSDKESKQEKVQAKKLLQRGDKENSANPSDKRPKGEKSTKDSGKATKQGTAANAKGNKSNATPNTTKETAAAPERRRERGNVIVATKILQRDLGLSTSGGRRRGKGGSTDSASPKNESSRDSAILPTDLFKKEITRPPKAASSAANFPKPRNGELSSRPDAAAAPPVTLPVKVIKGGKAKHPPTAKQAFLKHANPSQGVTEALLQSAFTLFGAVTKVEIDKKKGFGYIDFAEPEALRKAIAASPVSVAQSQVVVLERKENPGIEKTRKGRESFTPNTAKAPTETAGSTSGTGINVGSNASSFRGSRGGRGSRNKGPKGSAGASEKTGGTEAE